MIDVNGIVETNHYKRNEDVVVAVAGVVVAVVDQNFHYLKKKWFQFDSFVLVIDDILLFPGFVVVVFVVVVVVVVVVFVEIFVVVDVDALGVVVVLVLVEVRDETFCQCIQNNTYDRKEVTNKLSHNRNKLNIELF